MVAQPAMAWGLCVLKHGSFAEGEKKLLSMQTKVSRAAFQKMAMVEDITSSFEKIRIRPVAPIEFPKREVVYSEVNAALFNQQPWVIQVDSVLHRRRGILITPDTYDRFCHSFENETAARSFIGEVLTVVSTSDSVVRISDLQLEETNSHWDDKPRVVDPQFAPVNSPLIMSTKTIYSLSTKWEIVKTLYYIAFTQRILSRLFEEAICRTSLNGLDKALALPMVEKIPDIRLPEISVDVEVKEALKSASLKEATNNPPSGFLSDVLYSKFQIKRLSSWNSLCPC
jgi:hypothetical protein